MNAMLQRDEYAYMQPLADFRTYRIYKDIVIDGERFEVPAVSPALQQPLPAKRYLYVGDAWDTGVGTSYTGLRDPLLDLHEGPCSDRLTIKSGGRPVEVMLHNTGVEFSVDREGASMLLDFELDYLLSRHEDYVRHSLSIGYAGACGEGYKTYLRYGFIILAKGQAAKVDRILRRTAWRERAGLAGHNIDIDALIASGQLRVAPTVPLPDADQLAA